MMNRDADTGADDDFGAVQDKLSSLMAGPDPESDDEIATEDDVPSADDAPDETQASEENEADGKPEDPAIAAPSSWDSEAREKFAKLPPDLQEYISRREQERDGATQQRLQMAAEERRAAQQQQSEIAAMRQAYEQKLHIVMRQLESNIPEEFREIRSNADLMRLADTNPALVTKFRAWQDHVTSVAQEYEQLQQAKAYEMQAGRQQLVEQEFGALAQKWPDFVDQQKGSVIRSEITQYARQMGFSDEEIGTLADHRLVLVIRDALAGRKAASSLQNAQKKVAAKPLPKVVRPGSGEQASRAGVDRIQAAKVARSGDRANIQKTLERLLSS